VTNQQQERRQWWGSLAQTLIATTVVSVVGGGLGTYVAFKILEAKTESNTVAIAALNNKFDESKRDNDEVLRDMLKAISTINSDVSYLRGRAEPRSDK